MRGRQGFTLIELLVVLAVVAMLLSLVAPRYLHQADRAREAALREDLSALRNAIDQYYGDKGQYPAQLEDLVREKYLRRLPEDPITRQSATWQPQVLEEEGRAGIYDVRSGAPGNGLDQTPYNSW